MVVSQSKVYNPNNYHSTNVELECKPMTTRTTSHSLKIDKLCRHPYSTYLFTIPLHSPSSSSFESNSNRCK